MNPVSAAFPVFLFSFIASAAFGQAEDSVRYAEAVKYASGLHDSQLRNQRALLNGSVFVDYPQSFTSGSPYLSPAHFQDGSVDYDGIRFEHVPLVFDELADGVVAGLPLPLRLLPEKTAGFDILDRHFVRIPASVYPAARGFYEWLVSGRISLYRKVSKTLVAKSVPPNKEVVFSITEVITYFLQKENSFVAVGEDKKWPALLDDKPELLSRFIRENGKFPEALRPENYLRQLVNRYNNTP